MRSKILTILTVGVILRLVLSSISYHSDVQAFDLAGQVIGQGNVLNFYDYLPNLDQDDPILKSYPTYLFNYPPAVYFTVSTLSFILTLPISGEFHQAFLFNIDDALKSPLIFLHLLLQKIPYLIFDLGCAYLLYNFFQKSNNKILALTLWMFNPLVLYATYLMGQFDIIPTFFTILALYIVKKHSGELTLQKALLTSVVLGAGAAFKIYPILFVIPLAFLLPGWRDRSLVIGAAIVTYLIPILPFLGSSGFRSSALVANQTLKSLYPQIPVSGGESIILFLALVGFLYLVFLYNKTKKELLWQRFFIALLVFFIFTHYHPQWFLWLTPFLIIELVVSKFKHLFLIFISTISFLGLLLFFDPGLTIGLFSPLNPALHSSPGILELLGLKLDQNFSRSVLHTLFVSVGIYYIFAYFPSRRLE